MPLSGDEIVRLYDCCAESMLVFLARRTGNPEAAVDILAETFASAFEDREQFRGNGDDAARAWLYGIARHELADYFRHEHAQRRALTRLGVERRALTDAEYERIEELAASRDLRGLVPDLIEELPAEQREAVHLRVVEGYSYAVVAGRLGISAATARARVSRAMRTLRTRIECDFDEEPTEPRRINHA